MSFCVNCPFKRRRAFNHTHVDEADVQLFGSVASLQVAAHVNIIVTYDSCDYVGRGDALCSLSRRKHALKKRI